MAGINLLKHVDEEEVAVEVESKPSMLSRSDLTTAQKIKLVLILGGFAMFYLVRDHVNNTYLPAQLVEPQAELNRIQGEIKTTQRQLNELKDLEKFIEEHNQRIVDLKNRIRALQEIKEGQRDKAVRMVDFIVTQMPQPIWITNLELGSKAGANIVLKGYSRNYQTISEFFNRLEEGAYFSEWALVGTSLAEFKEADNPPIKASQFELRTTTMELPQ